MGTQRLQAVLTAPPPHPHHHTITPSHTITHYPTLSHSPV
jgi:hypothetical protein